MNSSPVTAGIQYSLAQPCSITLSPTDLTTPEETMKLAQSIAPSTSDSAPAFQEAEHQAPDHAQHQAVDEQAGDVPGRGDEREEDEGDLGAPISPRMAVGPPVRRGFRDHLDAGDLGKRVAEHLGDHQGDLVLHRASGAASAKLATVNGLRKAYMAK